MLKKISMMLILYYCSTSMLLTNVKMIAIPAKDFHVGNSLILIACDGNGLEKVAGYVSLEAGKTQFSFDEISLHHERLSSIADQKSAVVADVKDVMIKKDDDVIYLYFEIDPTINIIRALVITNSLLTDKPFDVIEFSTGLIVDEENDDDNDFFESLSHDEFSHLNLTDIQTNAPTQLSLYNKTVLAVYAMWAVKSSELKYAYKKFVQWCTSYHAE